MTDRDDLAAALAKVALVPDTRRELADAIDRFVDARAREIAREEAGKLATQIAADMAFAASEVGNALAAVERRVNERLADHHANLVVLTREASELGGRVETVEADQHADADLDHELDERLTWLTQRVEAMAAVLDQMGPPFREPVQSAPAPDGYTVEGKSPIIHPRQAPALDASAPAPPGPSDADATRVLREMLKAEEHERDFWADRDPGLSRHYGECADALTAALDAMEVVQEYEGVDGRCSVGHNKKFTYNLFGAIGCVVCEKDAVEARLAGLWEQVEALPWKISLWQMNGGVVKPVKTVDRAAVLALMGKEPEA